MSYKTVLFKDVVKNRFNRSWRWIKKYFFGGIIVFVPIALSLWILIKAFQFFDNFLGKYIMKILGFKIPGLGLITTFILIIIAGFIKEGIGKGIFSTIDQFFSNLPLVRVIYSATKQIFEMIQSGKSTHLGKVMLVEYPRKGLWAIAFMTSEKAPLSIEGNIGEDHVALFLPTTPNPTSGFLIYAKKKEIKEVDMTPEDAIKLVISAGALHKEIDSKRKVTRSDKIDS